MEGGVPISCVVPLEPLLVVDVVSLGMVVVGDKLTTLTPVNVRLPICTVSVVPPGGVSCSFSNAPGGRTGSEITLAGGCLGTVTPPTLPPPGIKGSETNAGCRFGR